jgi:signal transduction histidine kinase
MVYEFLQKIPLFSGLSEEHLVSLCEMAVEVRLPAGEVLFNEGEEGNHAYIIREGQLEIIKVSGGRTVLIAVRSSGEVIGEMSLLESVPRTATVRARSDCVLIAIGKEQLNHLLDNNPSAARAMLHTVTARLRSTEIQLRQSDKMAQLGTLTASMAHELNNPSAAALRGSDVLRTALDQLQTAQMQISQIGLLPDQAMVLQELETQIRQAALTPIELDAIERSDRQLDLEEWLQEYGIDDAWEIAPSLVNMGLERDQLEKLRQEFPPVNQFNPLPVLFSMLNATFTISAVLEEINQGARQISEIVKAMKNYVYLDQAPIQPIDLHEGLDNTLVILRGKLKKGVTVQRNYAPNLPRIQAYGSELNQVWTNILDNAIDALLTQADTGQAHLTERTQSPTIQISTCLDGDWVVVELEDNGPGISPENQTKIFNPFFTTKPLGKGTGLGLNTSANIVHKHGGEIKVHSQPGQTIFEVRLPVNFDAPG